MVLRRMQEEMKSKWIGEEEKWKNGRRKAK